MLQAQHSPNPFLSMDISEINYNVNGFDLQGGNEPAYCLCGKPYDPNIFMIQCDGCNNWFHSSCCSVQEWQAVEIDKYHCPRCVPIVGPSILKPYINIHRHDYWDDALHKPVQTGTPAFIRELCSRHFATAEQVVIKLKGEELTEKYLDTKGFNNPILIDSKEGLGMHMPNENFTVYDVMQLVGPSKEIDVIDVGRQSNMRMSLKEFVEYYYAYIKSRIFNVVSLEFSNTPMASIVEPPEIAQNIDWANTVWPVTYEGKPQVQKYCLMSVKDSYTDFHIDFGGTSVWYHVLKGEKVFFLIKPTPANLTLYSQWMTSTNQSETFFGDQVDQCFKCHVKQGQTMFIPTGWIHAVYTVADSLVFGGNFLHGYNIAMQLSCYEIEKKTKTEKKFLYPNFITINFFAGLSLLKKINDINLKECQCPNMLLTGIKALLQGLKQWNSEKDYNMAVREQLPYNINIQKLLKDMGKEIRHAERYINHLNPPKPERESKRKRKKPVNKDFVDYSASPKMLSQEYVPTTNAQPVAKPNTTLKLTIPKPSSFPYPSRTNVSVPSISYTDDSQTVSNNTEIWNMPYDPRPQETVAEHKGGTVLKFKLGAKDYVLPERNRQGNNDNRKDVYDFHDDSDRDEDCLNIDEKPQKKRRASSGKAKNQNEKIEQMLNSNGIESLLQASLTVPGRHDGGTSPSTSEAIAGMLSISQNWNTTKPKKSKRRNSSLPEENVNNVHQDEDYIYPSLDNSDDEEVHIFKPRGRTKVDEAWNPKARVGPLLPKMNRPAREGTKKQAVEKVLEAAAARRVNSAADRTGGEQASKRQYRRKKPKPKIENRSPASGNGPSTSSSPRISNSAAAGSSSNGAAGQPASAQTPRLRKGMKTVKQRLGKILKIHKMIH